MKREVRKAATRRAAAEKRQLDAFAQARALWEKKQELAAPSRYYGNGGTIHSSGTIEIGVDHEGRVVAVWFRCQLLPFRQYAIDPLVDTEVRNPAVFITGVELLDLSGQWPG